jgi:hypothetical protein
MSRPNVRILITVPVFSANSSEHDPTIGAVTKKTSALKNSFQAKNCLILSVLQINFKDATNCVDEILPIGHIA